MGTETFDDVIKAWEELDWVALDDSPGLRVCSLPVDQDSEATLVCMDYGPNFEIPTHHHTCDHIEVVIKGEINVTGRREPAGSMRFVPRDAVYGPLIAGPEGARVIEIFPIHTIEAVSGRYEDPEIAAKRNGTERERELARKLGLDI